MKIILNIGGPALNNLGDNAMVVAAIDHILAFDPNAEISVICQSKKVLDQVCPGNKHLPVQWRDNWFQQRLKILPNFLLKIQPIEKLELKISMMLALYHPKLAYGIRRWIKWLTHCTYGNDVLSFYEAIEECDVVIASGGGFVNDHFLDQAELILSVLYIAQKLGKPTTMFGQGFGPLTDEKVIKLARKTLPKLKLIGLREGLFSNKTLRNIVDQGLPVTVTGDDAIKLAIDIKPTSMSSIDVIGVNLRITDSSGVNDELVQIIKRGLSDLRLIERVHFIPVPISLAYHKDLISSTAIADFDDVEELIARELKDVNSLLKQIARCNVIITGSYHAAVFGLSLGIPIVAIIQSEYYRQKFLGLGEQFKDGILYFDISDGPTSEDLVRLIQVQIQFDEIRSDKLRDVARSQRQKSADLWREFLGSL